MGVGRVTTVVVRAPVTVTGIYIKHIPPPRLEPWLALIPVGYKIEGWKCFRKNSIIENLFNAKGVNGSVALLYSVNAETSLPLEPDLT